MSGGFFPSRGFKSAFRPTFGFKRSDGFFAGYPVSASPWDALRSGGGATLMTAMGLPAGTVPNGMWLIESAGAADDRIADNDLSPTTIVAVSDSKLGGPCAEWDGGSTDNLSAASSAVFDVTTESVAVLWVGLVTSAPAATRNMLQKRDTTDGFQLRVEATNNVRMVNIDDSASSTALTTAGTYADGNAFVAMGGLDLTRTNETFVVTDREARVETDKGSVANLTSTATFGLGTGGGIFSAPMRVRLVAIWIGAGAEQFGASAQTYLQTLKAYLRI